jgi:GT2 family glycosyltransferase
LIDHPELLQSFDFPDPENVPFLHFYTCNLSLARSLFEKVGGFDEAFTSYGFEDVDFGYRLNLLGHHIVHDPRASAIHDPSLSFAEFAQRRRHAGFALGYLLEKHPELLPQFFPASGRYRRYVKLTLGRLCGLLRPTLDRFSSKSSHRVSRGLTLLYHWFFEYEFSRGFAHYRTKRVSPSSHSTVS